MGAQAYEQYEVIADEYARTFPNGFESRPLDRAILHSFAELAVRSGGTRALDVGCGPGQAAAELASCGLRTEGVDGSAAMIALARQGSPSVRFRTADMFDLPFEAETFDAVCAWYSIIHTPGEALPELFAEYRRVLTDPGWLLLAFQTEGETAVYDQAFGRDVNLTFLRHDTAMVCDALERSGFTVYATTKRARQAQLDEPTARAMVIAHARDVKDHS